MAIYAERTSDLKHLRLCMQPQFKDDHPMPGSMGLQGATGLIHLFRFSESQNNVSMTCIHTLF